MALAGDFLSSYQVDYLEEQYQSYLKNPQSVELDLRLFFQGFEAGSTEIAVDKKTGQVSKKRNSFFNIDKSALNHEDERIFSLISAYRRHGHLQSRVNPLQPPANSRFLAIEEHGFSEEDLHVEFAVSSFPGSAKRTLLELIKQLESAYCGTLSVEYHNIQEPEEFSWLQKEFENINVSGSLENERKLWLYDHLFRASSFEKWLQIKYPGQKRFSLEGLDSLIPGLHSLFGALSSNGAQEVLLGMAHRGRLSVLANVMGKPLESIFSEFTGETFVARGDGDVKYHLGYFNQLSTFYNSKISVYLNPNPSHLELVNPVIQGRVYSRQKVLGDQEKRIVIPVLIHGDAALCGQGINLEMLQLSRLRGYSVGGCIHIVLDNQIGFTAEARESRSTRYATDLFKIMDSPVFHVNADDPEALFFAMDLASRFRQKFLRDVAINLVGFRRYGHNEADEPAFTQPLMYQKIRKHPGAAAIYRQKIINDGIQESEILKLESSFQTFLEQKYQVFTDGSALFEQEKTDPGWDEILVQDSDAAQTGVSFSVLEKITKTSLIPEEVEADPKIIKFYKSREASLKNGVIDWAFAESLCFGSLLLEKIRVRLSGQDSRRGTFTQRNLVVFNRDNGSEYIPLNHIDSSQRDLCVFNSCLSELAVLGFEYGFSLGNPKTLVMWEAQFGDFSNGAQAMIDVFIASGESKWLKQSGLVLLLPHGYEGQGPEHSSARLERYLQLCGTNNMRVCYPTTPANYFHVLRRQVIKKDRRPLVVMTPKSLLRLRECVSMPEDFLESTKFEEVIVGAAVSIPEDQVFRVLLCTGKIYYELEKYRKENRLFHIEIVRLEQLYPFPEEKIDEIFQSWPNLRGVYWVQEERKNMGAYSFVHPKLSQILKPYKLALVYVGREEGASPCAASHKLHLQQQAEIIRRSME